MKMRDAAALFVGVFVGLGGASHGPGEILQGNTVPGAIMIKAWPALTSTAFGGEPAMTLIPNFIIAGVFAIFFGALIAALSGSFFERRWGGALLIVLSFVLLLVGGGIVPPLIGMAAGAMGSLKVRGSGVIVNG